MLRLKPFVKRVYAKHVETIFQLSNLRGVKYIKVDITHHDVSLSIKGKSHKNVKNLQLFGFKSDLNLGIMA